MRDPKKILGKSYNYIFEIFLVVCSVFISFVLLSHNETMAQSIPEIPSNFIDEVWDKIIKTESAQWDIRGSILFKKLVPNTIKLLFYIWSAIAVIAIFYSWYTILTSFWDSKRFQTWWQIFWYTTAWVFVMFFSRWIIWIIENIRISNINASWSDFGLDSSVDIGNLPTWEFESEIVPNIIWIAVELVSLVIIVLMIYAWIMYITSPLWAEKNKDKAKDIMVDSLVWLALLLVSYAFVQWLFNINFWG